MKIALYIFNSLFIYNISLLKLKFYKSQFHYYNYTSISIGSLVIKKSNLIKSNTQVFIN